MKDLYDYYKENKAQCLVLAALALTAAVMLLMFNFKGHDYPYHIQRIASIAEEIKFKGLGAFPIRVFSTNEYGYGYASPLFYGDIFLYPFALMVCLGLNAVYAYRFMLVSLYIICFFGMYFAAKQISKRTDTALMAACLYTFSAYFAVDVFTRSAIGESFAFAFCPYIAYGFYCTIINPAMPKKHRLFLVFGMSGMILSHLISTVVTTVLMAVFLIIYCRDWIHNKRVIADFVCMALLTAAVSAFFIFPLLEQMASSKFYSTAGTKWNSANYALSWYGWIAPHGFWKLRMDRFYEAAMASWYPGGFGFMLVTLLAVWLCNIKKLKKRMPVALLITSVVMVFIIMGVPIPLKYTHKLFDFMRLPWRTLLFVTLFTSIFGAYAVHELRSKAINRILTVMLVIPFFIVSVSSYQIIRAEIPNMDSEYTLTSDQIGTGYEYLPYELTQAADGKDFNEYLRSLRKSVTSSNPNVDVYNYKNDDHGTVEFSFRNNNYANSSFEVPLLYYKGYSAKDTETGDKYKVSVSDKGLVEIEAGEAQSGDICVRYTGTLVQHISDIISVLTVAILLIYISKPKWLIKLYEKIKGAIKDNG